MSFQIIDVDETAFAKKYHLSPLTAKLLAASDISEEKIRDILSNDMEMHTSQAPCVQKCAKRILAAKENKEKVFVGGDYDADGICATAIMKATLDALGIINGYYIPDRFKEGYGLQPKTVEAAVKKGYTLILTVDNGVKAHEAIEKAKELHTDIIITDHHQIDEPAGTDTVVHPDYMEEEYRYLSGAGIALEISRTLIGDHPELTALACVAAIGDVMPLYAETRIIVKNGIQALRHNAVPALTPLFRRGASIDETAIGFQIVPKLNSVGRLNDTANVNTLVPYLLLRDPLSIQRYAAQLEAVNERRKSLSRTMSAKCEKMLGNESFEILYDENFEEGICGLAAGRIANTYHKPTLVLTKGENGRIKGSGRSVPGFDLFHFFSQDFDMFTAFGGHEQAVGLSMKEEDYEGFVAKVREKMQAADFTYEEPKETVIRVSGSLLTFQNVTDLSILSPYPRDLVSPLFAIENPQVLNVFRSPKVTKYHIAVNGSEMDALMFPYQNLTQTDHPSRMIGSLSINRFRNNVSVQMMLVDLQ
ncbi:MAG: DHH family phosphoesterase [Bulleidia sp.]|nr:DHH family phosphoesterase [Bulleidia sp.]